MEYNTDLFNPETITRFLSHYRILLEFILANPDKHLAEMPLLSEEEKRYLLVDLNSTKTNYPMNQSLSRLFETQVELAPDAISIVFQNDHLTYGELNRRTNQLARYLKSQGVDSEAIVGVYLDRSQELIITLLAILKSGGAYLPLDPTYPDERLAFILDNARVQQIVTTSLLQKAPFKW